MKKLFAWGLAALLLMGVLVACGGGNGAAAGTGSSADYKVVLEAARPESAENIPVITSPEEDGPTGLLDFFGVPQEDMKKYAISVSLINVKAYGIAIILPQEGKEQAVTDAVNAFVELQQKGFENYLQDQYAIAKGALVKTAPTGEVILVMCEDAATVMAAIEKGLAA
ncbi:DUF4358 domain-containing protein [Ruminococcaceae bacterium OttesenSCG-928-A16]|nr:DUF4358 domain-containing protein [Ruminococcaceae bacterium OttesenSCG-928-A16]